MGSKRRTRTRRQSRWRWLGSWIATLLLSLLYYVVTAMCLLFGGILAWNGATSLGGDRWGATGRLGGGVALIILGIAVFVFFPRLVKRWTGHEVVSSPYPMP